MKETFFLKMEENKLIFFLCVLLCIKVICFQVNAEECFKNNNNYYCKLSSATPYRLIANYNDSQLKYPGKYFGEKLLYQILIKIL